jgi:hypothetical protein
LSPYLEMMDSTQWTWKGRYLFDFISIGCIVAGLLDHMASLFLIFWKASVLFFIVAYELTFSPMYKLPVLFLTSLWYLSVSFLKIITI